MWGRDLHLTLFIKEEMKTSQKGEEFWETKVLKEHRLTLDAEIHPILISSLNSGLWMKTGIHLFFCFGLVSQKRGQQAASWGLSPTHRLFLYNPWVKNGVCISEWLQKKYSVTCETHAIQISVSNSYLALQRRGGLTLACCKLGKKKKIQARQNFTSQNQRISTGDSMRIS